MNQLGIYIVEDEELYANQLEILVDELGYELVGVSDNSDVARKEITDKNPDLVLMDVKINGSMNGIDLASTLHPSIAVIFITSFGDEATFNRAKQVKPHAYITKPFDAENLQRSIELAIGSLSRESSWEEDVMFEKCLFIKNRHRLEKVNMNEILYLEVENRYSTVYTKGGKKHVLRMGLGEVQEKLTGSSFMRIHRKYTINLAEVTAIDTKDNMILLGATELPISRIHKEELLQKLDWLQ